MFSTSNGPLEATTSTRGSRDHRDGQTSDVHVQNIPLDMIEEQLEDIFVQCGNVLSVRVLPARDQRTTKVGFVSYASDEEAAVAIEQLNGYQVGNCSLRVLKARVKSTSMPTQTSENKVHIMNIPLHIAQNELQDIFSQCGTVTSVKILPPKENRSSTVGFVEYTNEEEVNAALQNLNGYQIGAGYSLKVSKAVTRDSGSRGSEMSGSSQLEPKVHVANIPIDMTEENLRAIFAECGEVMSVKILQPKDGWINTNGFVTFTCEESVSGAIDSLNGYQVGNFTLKVSRARGKSSAPRDSVNPFSNTSQPHVNSFKVQTNEKSGQLGSRLPQFPLSDQQPFVNGSDHQPFVNGITSPSPQAVSQNTVTNNSQSGILSAPGRAFMATSPTPNQFSSSVFQSSPEKKGVPSRQTESVQVSEFSSVQERRGKSIGNADNKSCHKCGEFGHFARECRSQGGNTCHRCGMAGHFARECPSAGARGGGGACHKCGEVGHFARECQNPQTSNGKSGAGPVTYIPAELPEDPDTLFENMVHSGINFERYDKIPVEVTGRNPPPPIHSFDQAGMFEQCARNIRRAKFTKPTPVQKHTIPIVNSGRDLMACAQTGSGKTVAYLVPVLTGMLKQGLVNRSSITGEVQEPMALCLAPTRELARQIHQESFKFAQGTVVRTVVCYGGVNVNYQLQNIQRGCHFLIATPGRLDDFVGRGKVSLVSVRYLILDEADRMLDMGFESVVRKIVNESGMPNKYNRQTIMLSATFPDRIQHLAADFLKEDYLFCAVGRVGGTNTDITQYVVEVCGDEKRDRLFEILQETGTDRTLVFVELKRIADFLANWLSQNKFASTSITSDRSQQEREAALEDFRSGRAPIMVATSVAARGLDIKDVKHVINYDLPQAIEDYVHRIGRTGRIGNEGKATSFYESGRDDKLARSLVKVLSEASQEVPEWLEHAAEEAFGSSYGPSGGKFASRDRRQKYGENRTASASSKVDNQRVYGVTQGLMELRVQNGSHFQHSVPVPAAVSSGGADDDENWD